MTTGPLPDSTRIAETVSNGLAIPSGNHMQDPAPGDRIASSAIAKSLVRVNPEAIALHSIDKSRLALGIRQPWAELIVRGVKCVEVRKFDTKVRGRIYVYASRQFSDHPAAAIAAHEYQLDLQSLTRGMVVGSVEIVGTDVATPADARAACLRPEDLDGTHLWGWRLASSDRFDNPVSIRFLPYGIWFYPFRPRRPEGA